MTRFQLGIVAASAVAFSALATPANAQAPTPNAVAFENVTVIPVDRERTLARQTVLVRDRRIAAIGPAGSVDLPDGATRVDGTGKYLIPGMAEMHGHIPGGQNPGYTDRVLLLFVANGITTVRGMLGATSQPALRAAIDRGEKLGPQLFLAGPSLNGNSVPTPDAARRAVTEHRAAGFDLLKIHPGIRRDVYDEISATAAREGIHFAGHVPADVGLLHALEAGQRTIEHVDGYIEALVPAGAPVNPRQSQWFGYNLIDHIDESKIPSLVAATEAAGAWVTPTQVLFENGMLEPPETTAQRPEMMYLSAEQLDGYVRSTRRRTEQLGLTGERAGKFIELRRRLIKDLHDAGVGILLGADAPQVFNVPGFATLQEMTALVAAGLSPYAALEAGTKNPAVYLGKEGSFGTVEVGKRADLVLLDGNPLTDIHNVKRQAGVMVAGVWLSADDIAERLAELRRPASD